MFIFCVFFNVIFLLSLMDVCVCVCDKCNDFVFHYLLDYSCRVLLVDSVLFLVLKKPLISFNVLGVENSFALFSRKIAPRRSSHKRSRPVF